MKQLLGQADYYVEILKMVTKMNQYWDADLVVMQKHGPRCA